MKISLDICKKCSYFTDLRNVANWTIISPDGKTVIYDVFCLGVKKFRGSAFTVKEFKNQEIQKDCPYYTEHVVSQLNKGKQNDKRRR